MKELKWWKACRFLRFLSVGKQKVRQILFPVPSLQHHKCPQNLFQSLIAHTGCYSSCDFSTREPTSDKSCGLCREPHFHKYFLQNIRDPNLPEGGQCNNFWVPDSRVYCSQDKTCPILLETAIVFHPPKRFTHYRQRLQCSPVNIVRLAKQLECNIELTAVDYG